MSATMEAILTRRSCRKFKQDMIPRPVLEEIVQAGTYAATGMGKQSPIILAVTNRAMRDRLSAMNAAVMGKGPENDPFYGAPVVMVVLADRAIGTHLYDGSLVMGNLMLAAHDHSIGSCWIHRAREEFDSPEGKAILADLGITGDYEGIGHCILGYPEEGGVRPAVPRKDGYVHWIE